MSDVKASAEPGRSPEPPAPAATLRFLVRAHDRGALATLLARAPLAGAPYASLVLYATAVDGAPLLLLSDLADHTGNLKAEPRASLLVDGTAGLDDPLTGARASLIGRIRRTEDEADKRRYLARHPSAATYAGFGDFNCYRMEVEAAHLVAGFGRIHWLRSDTFDWPSAPDIAAAEPDVIDHMNQDHQNAVALYATRLLGLQSGDWRLTGIDAEGCDLRVGGRVARLAFPQRLTGAHQLRQAFIDLTKAARGR